MNDFQGINAGQEYKIMKIRISSIPPEGLKISDTLSLEALNRRMMEGRDNDILFTLEPRVDLEITRNVDGAESCGSVTSTYIQPCALCAEPVEQQLTVRADYIFKHRPDFIQDNDEYSDDIGLIYYNGDHIDLEEILQESIILALRFYLKPPRKDDGSCKICGKTPGFEESVKSRVTLGNLLQNTKQKT
ncbi:MAG: DUF177 domain-containing protein [Candidatus Dadabacteria bacterium]|nr:MAG: DUF177 domain-containing protein [Candidatus Dadabacteria bacterium]